MAKALLAAVVGHTHSLAQVVVAEAVSKSALLTKNEACVPADTRHYTWEGEGSYVRSLVAVEEEIAVGIAIAAAKTAGEDTLADYASH